MRPDLECPAALEVFTLEKDLCAGESIERSRREDRRAVCDFADAFGRRADIREGNVRIHMLSIHTSNLFETLLE